MAYEIITAYGKLTDEHRQELKTKRGFTDATISRCRFFSGGAYLLELETRLLKEFELDKLIQKGLFHVIDGKPAMTQRILEDRIIIPYLDQNGKAQMIRPHKLGLKDVGIDIYQEINVSGPDKKGIILTEGEFKAAAAQQLGIPAIGLPGVGSFSKTHFARLVEFLNKHNVKEIAIIFDNEIKDDPRFENYKDNPAKRWDSQFYAFFMAKLLTKEGFKANIAWLPDGWRTGGKVDIDGAVAMGKTKEDFLQLIQISKSSKHFFEDLPEEAQRIIKRKMAQKYFRSHIRNEFGKYVATRWRGRTEIDEEISNFTLKILATHETIEGIVREIQFLDETNDPGHCFAMKADEMGADAFATFCLSKGNYVWKGKKEDLQILWQENFLNDDGRHIIEPDHIGYLEREKMWMFSNVAITDKGDEMRPDENGIFWTEKRGYKPVSLGISSGKQAISEGLPYLSINDEVNIQDIKKNLSDTIGDTEAAKALAWITSVVFMENAFKKYGCFPFLFVTGKTGSGKSTVADWICSFFGIEHNGITLSQTTAVAIQRSLGYYSSIPVFLDEYRNTADIIYKTHFLRNVYNRQSSGKGMKANFGLRMAKVRGTVVIAGEELPNDAALINRSIIIEIIKAKKREDHYEWFCREKSKFSRFFYDILKNKKALDEKFDSMMMKGKIAFMASKIDERTAINYAILCAGYACSFGESKEFAQMIVADIKRVQTDNKEASMISQFIQDISAMKFNGQIDGRYWETKSDGEVHIYFQGLYNLWAKDCRQRGINILKADSLRGYFKEEPGFVRNNYLTKIDNKPVRCTIFRLDEASQEIQELVNE